MLAFLLALCLLFLALLYRCLPSRKIFLCFCLTLALVGCIAWAANQPRAEAPAMTQEEKYALQIQEKIFMDWYANYQKDMDRLDRNWQWYHAIIENFKEGSIDIQTAYVRLNQLEEDSRLLRDRLRSLAPPAGLDDTCHGLVARILQKTVDYADAQHRTIALTRAVADPVHLQTDDPAEQSRSMQEVMLRESPAGLFTASEVLGLREHLDIPKET